MSTEPAVFRKLDQRDLPSVEIVEDPVVTIEFDKEILAKNISGALRSAIDAHGPIDKNFIGSATKRIVGAITNYQPLVIHEMDHRS